MSDIIPTSNENSPFLGGEDYINKLLLESQHIARKIEQSKDKPQKLTLLVENYNNLITEIIRRASMHDQWIKQNRRLIDYWLHSEWVKPEIKKQLKEYLPKSVLFSADMTQNLSLMKKFIHAVSSTIKAHKGMINFLPSGTKPNPGMQIRIGFDHYNHSQQARNDFEAIKATLASFGIAFDILKGNDARPILTIRPSDINKNRIQRSSFTEDFSKRLKQFRSPSTVSLNKKKP